MLQTQRRLRLRNYLRIHLPQRNHLQRLRRLQQLQRQQRLQRLQQLLLPLLLQLPLLPQLPRQPLLQLIHVQPIQTHVSTVGSVLLMEIHMTVSVRKDLKVRITFVAIIL